MSFPIPPFTESVTCKELAYYIPNRTPRWVANECKEKRIRTHPIGKPYLIPANEANRILSLETEKNND